MFRYGCLLAVIVLVGLPVLASRFLPWWGICLVILAEGVGLVVIGPKLVAFGIKRFAIGLFKTKSQVLKGAAVHVHSVELTAKPVDENDALADQTENDEAEAGDVEPADDSRYVLIDFTLTPMPGQSKMTHWEPDELMLVPFDLPNDAKEDDHVSASIVRMRMVDDGGNETEDFDKIVGPGRFKAIFACPNGLRGRVKFRYYFEGFGDVMLP
jgi:hypothetical protein